MPIMEGRSEGKRRLTVREAATLLDVHPNTVRNRIKDGSIAAEKVVTERGPTWMINPDSLTTNALPSGSQQLVGRVPEEALTFLAREIVKEAGLQRNPEIEHWRENMRAYLDALKHISTLAGASVVALVLIQQALGQALGFDTRFVAVILVLVGLSFLLAIVGVLAVSFRLHQPSEYPLRTFYWNTVIAGTLLIAGIWLFIGGALGLATA